MKVYGRTPWGRDYYAALSDDERAAIEARIPDGYRMSIGAKTRPGRDWVVRIHHAGDVDGLVAVAEGADLARTCLRATELLAVPA